MESFRRVSRVAQVRDHNDRPRDVFIDVKWDAEGKRLSITGVEGPTAHGNAWGSCGQIDLSVGDYSPINGVDLERLSSVWRQWHLNDMRAGCEHQRAAGWGTDGRKVTLYHYTMNTDVLVEKHNLRRRLEKEVVDTGKAAATEAEQRLFSLPSHLTTDGDAENGPDATEYSLDKTVESAAGWVTEKEHPEGVLSKPCPECGYKYGTKWLKEDVPEDVLEYLKGLKDSASLMPTAWLR